MRPVTTLLTLLAVAYAGGLLLWEVLRRSPVSGWPPFQLVDLFGLWWYVPLPLFLLVAVLRRAWRTSLLLLLPLLVFAVVYGPLFLPRRAPSDLQAPSLRLMTSNLMYRNADAASLVAVLRDQQVDVALVQELGPAMARALEADPVVLAAYPYRALVPDGTTRGMGLLSRVPILEALPPEMDDDQCACQEVAVEVAGRAVTVLNVHPRRPSVAFQRRARLPFGLPVPSTFDPEQFEPRLQAILQRARDVEGPLIVGGDFNTSDRQPLYGLLQLRLRDSYREAGWGLGYTFPSGAGGSWQRLVPLMRIDYLFHDDAWRARAAFTVRVPGSDHRAVVAELALLR